MTKEEIKKEISEYKESVVSLLESLESFEINQDTFQSLIFDLHGGREKIESAVGKAKLPGSIWEK